MPRSVFEVCIQVVGKVVVMARYVGINGSGNKFIENRISVQEDGEKI